jgi:hypothetical protein
VNHEDSGRLSGPVALRRLRLWCAGGLAGAVLVLGGCSLSPSADFIEALGKDQATVSVRVNTIYGTIMFCRTAILNGNVSCNGDGISVKSEAANVGVPMTITPELSIGQPTLRQSPPAKAAPPAVVPQSAPVKPMSWLVEPPDRIRDLLGAHHAFFATPPQQR